MKSIKILVIYHSQTGHIREMAQAVAEGAGSVENVEVVLKKASAGFPVRNAG